MVKNLNLQLTLFLIYLFKLFINSWLFQSSINDSIQDVPRAKWKEINVAGANGYKPIPYVVWTYSTASGSFPSKDTYRITFKNV